MKITQTYYDFHGKDYVYILTSKGSIIGYRLISIVDGVETLIEIVQVPPLTDYTITLPAEGQYDIVIYYPENGGTTTAVYDLRCYPELKEDMIRTFKDAICNCPNIGAYSTCTNNPLSAVQQDVNFLEMVYNSVNLYRDLLMSPSFLRKYSCCFMTTLGENYYTLESLLKQLYESVSLNGYTPDSMRLLRIYTAYYYIMIFVMELDMASCEDNATGNGGTTGTGSGGTGDPPSPDSEAGSPCEDTYNAVLTLFDTTTMKECFIRLGLNFNEIYNSFNNCYLQNPIGLCVVAEDVTPPDPPPGVATIDNLTYLNYERWVEAGTDVIPSIFSWEITGEPEDLLLWDSEGQLVDVPVTGTGYNSGAETYNLADSGQVRWFLKGSNTAQINLIVNWVYPYYYGRKATGAPPDATEIKAGTKAVSGNLKNEVIVDIATAITQYGWVALPVDEATSYDSWQVGESTLNTGPVGTSLGSPEFIITNPKAHVDVDGVMYRIFIYNYASEVDEDLRLFHL